MANYENGNGTKELIIKTAQKLFYEKGYDSTSMGDIAKEADVNRALLYYHFKTKDEIRRIVASRCAVKNTEEAVNFTGDVYTSWLVSEYIFWYKMTTDERYSKFQYDCNTHGDFGSKQTIEMMNDLFPFEGVTYDISGSNGKKTRPLDDAFVQGIMSQLIIYVHEHPAEYTYLQLAEEEISVTGKIYGVEPESMAPEINKAREELQLVKWQELDTTLNG